MIEVMEIGHLVGKAVIVVDSAQIADNPSPAIKDKY